MAKELQQGDRWFQTRDTGLAAVLSALDFEFFDNENPCDIREVGGEKMSTWQFMAEHGKLQATEVLKAWKEADKYCESKPMCRIASAIAAVKNLRMFNEGIKKGNPIVGYKLGGNIMWIPKGHPKEAKLIKDGRAKKI